MPNSLVPGAKLGRYKIRSKIGEGGMGEVYLATDTKLDRNVALKILPLEFAAQHDRMRRFVFEKQNHVIRGGSDTLPRALAAKLADRIRYGCAVLRIEQDKDGVRVICSRGGERETINAQYVVCAIPFSVLRLVEFSPPVSPEKQKAIAQLGNTSVVRVFLQTRRRFWLDEGLTGASSDLASICAHTSGPD